ncbi:MAG TPA: protein kinase [Blastocatellia bacterium]|nr:protein kinase [Blastocatellia bacterium]
MITCPSCSHSVSDQAASCPSCGFAIVDEFTPTRHQAPVGKPVDRKPAIRRPFRTTNSAESGASINEGNFVTGAVLAGRYRIVSLVGKGGMGQVYKAQDLKLNQVVALKFLPDAIAFDGAMLARFHSEVRIARQVSHSAVCRVYDIGEVEDRHFISMEFIDGEDLATLLRRIGRLPGDKAVEIARQICAGLAAAHESGVLHRDLKPANIMIDGRGNARITDFGLAVVSEELRGDEVLAGTPAYMSPEQLSGKQVTQRSDIYALGLVLYELFTGKRVYEVNDVHELIRLHEQSAPRTPTSYVKEIDPLVERVIMRCLEKDPRVRPSSAIQVAAALPGGDPLAAALAAGETPSPEMVAATTKEGALRPAVAVACFVAFFLLAGLILLTSRRVHVHRWVPLDKPPEVLAERARNLVTKLGYSAAPGDTAFGFEVDNTFINYMDKNPASYPLRIIDTGQPLIYYFWYRQSPRVLEPVKSTHVTPEDPPSEFSGMTRVILDPRGLLVEFSGVPPQFDRDKDTAPEFDWTPLFVESGLDPTKFTSTEAEWSPPTFADARAAWAGAYADHPDIPIRIEAASYRSQPVYFRIVAPWDTPVRQEQSQSSGREIAGVSILTAVLLTVIVAGVVFARRNLRLGRGDRQGAFKLALFLFTVIALGMLIGADHVPAIFGELSILYQIISYALFVVVMLWLLYIALEPYVRRHWPQLLISWTRLLAGEYRDPMVGRDVLVGVLIGLGHTTTIHGSILTMQLVDHASVAGQAGDVMSLTGFSYLIEGLLTSFGESVFAGLAPLFFLLLVYLFVRKRWMAASIMWAIISTVQILFFARSWVVAPFNLIIATILVFGVSRFGLLTAVVTQLVFLVSFVCPLTTDLSIWYANRSIFALVVLLALASYGAYVSLGDQKVFQSKLLEE